MGIIALKDLAASPRRHDGEELAPEQVPLQHIQRPRAVELALKKVDTPVRVLGSVIVQVPWIWVASYPTFKMLGVGNGDCLSRTVSTCDPVT